MTPIKRAFKRKSRLPDAPAPSPWTALSLHNPLVVGALCVFFVALVSTALSPSLLIGFQLPTEGAVAERDYRASHDFVFRRPNPSLARERQLAEEAVRPVYRYEPDLGERKSRTIAQVFREARRLIQEHEERGERIETDLQSVQDALREDRRVAAISLEQARAAANRARWPQDQGPLDFGEPPAPPSGPSVAELESKIRDLDEKLAAAETDAVSKRDALRADLARAMALTELDFRRELRLDASLRFEGATFQLLVDDRFSVASEDALQEIVETVMTRRIVRDLDRLQERLQEGISVLGEETKLTASDADLFLDVAAARQKAVESARQRFAAAAAPPSPRLQGVLAQLAALLVEENFYYDAPATAVSRQEARKSVPTETVDAYLKGQTLIESGQRITPRHIALMRAMQLGETGSRGPAVVVGIVLFVSMLFGLMGWIGHEWRSRLRIQRRDVWLFAAVVLVQLGLLRLSMAVTEGVITVWPTVPPMALYYAIPVAMGAMIIRLFTSVALAVAFGVVQALLAGIVFQGGAGPSYVWPLPLAMALYTLAGSLAGSFFLREVRQRSSLLVAGLKVGLFNASLVAPLHLVGGGSVDLSVSAVAAGGLLGGVLGYFAIIAITPVLEMSLGYATDIKLLELANMNNPALKELAMRAPGTYHHSIMVGNLAEAAAETIGANPLMTRVGAYYHDLGKMRNPRYFAENQGGENPHDKIKPHMSALIIKAHVKDGIEIARKYRLPEDIVDFVPQHHGSALIGFFYARAKEQALAEGRDVEESEFRYPGPRPQRKETALVMLADGVEASARSLPDPNPAALKALVKKIVNGKFIDGQLDECELTFRDLNAIVDSFNRVLVSIYHGRPEYPPIPGEQERARDRLGFGFGGEPGMNPDVAPDPPTSAKNPANDHSVASPSPEKDHAR